MNTCTDEQIIKALECCVSSAGGDACRGCPYDEEGICVTDGLALQRDSLALIKRQQEEIEKLNKVKVFNFTVSGTKEIMPILFCHEKELKNQAIKEFAERLKEKSEHFDLEKENFVSEANIDNLVKKMTEKEGGKG